MIATVNNNSKNNNNNSNNHHHHHHHHHHHDNNNNNEVKSVRFCELVGVYPIQNYKLPLPQKEKTIIWYRPEELIPLTTTHSNRCGTSHRRQQSRRSNFTKTMTTIKEVIAVKRRRRRRRRQRTRNNHSITSSLSFKSKDRQQNICSVTKNSIYTYH